MHYTVFMYNDLEDKIVNSIKPVCPMKMIVHYAVMVHPPVDIHR